MGGRTLYLGTVVSNGGDAAIQQAQLTVLGEALDPERVGLHDDSPVVAARLFPAFDVHGRAYPHANRPAGMSLPARVLRRANKARLQVLAGWWPRRRRLARVLTSAAEAEVLDSIAAADLVAYTGGTSLIEKYSVRSKLYEVDLALAMGRPVVLLPQSLGPFRDRANQEAVRRSLGRAGLILLRDELSVEHLREIGCRTDNVRVVPDIVFALATPAAVSRLADGALPASGARVAVSVRDCAAFFEGSPTERRAADSALRDGIAGLVTALVRDHDAEVTFVSTCQGVPEYWTDDSRVAKDVVTRLEPDVAARVVVDDGFHTTDGLLELLAGFDLAVCTRLHGAILALDAGTPVLPIAYEFKTHQVMAQLGMAELVTDITEGDTARLVDAHRRLVEALPALRAPVALRLGELAEGARGVGALVRDAVGRDGKG